MRKDERVGCLGYINSFLENAPHVFHSQVSLDRIETR
jgi:hypothetical protein